MELRKTGVDEGGQPGVQPYQTLGRYPVSEADITSQNIRGRGQ